MGTRLVKPITPGLRFRVEKKYTEITRDTPEKSLTVGRKNKAGRASSGRISVRRRGGGHKRRYRIIDFKRDKHGIPGIVDSIEYDPNRTSLIALVKYVDGEKRYILYPKGLTVGTQVISGPGSPVSLGNALALREIPLGTAVHNVELTSGKGGQLLRAAGSGGTLIAREGGYVTIRFPSGESRMIHENCYATIGSVGNEDLMNIKLGKAGRARWLRRRPKVRGVAMNPHDHPHGGGEGKTSGGRHPVTPWGTATKGYKTRKKRKVSSKYIVKKRK